MCSTAGRRWPSCRPAPASRSATSCRPPCCRARRVVVSPLIALMKDQCDKLRGVGVPAVQLNSAVGADGGGAAEQAIAAGRRAHRLHDARAARRSRASSTCCRRIRSACSSSTRRIASRNGATTSGRPSSRSAARLPRSATDDPRAHGDRHREVVDDIAQQLGVARFDVVSTGMYRAEPALPRRAGHERGRQAGPRAGGRRSRRARRRHRLHRDGEGGRSRARGAGRGRRIRRAAITAGSPPASAQANQEAFMGGERRVMVATNAFGLGIDKPDIRFVLHYQMPAGPRCLLPGVGARPDATAKRPTARCCTCTATRRCSSSSWPAATRRTRTCAIVYGAARRPRPARGDAHWTLERLQDVLDRPSAEDPGRAAAAAPSGRRRAGTRRPPDAAAAGLDDDALENAGLRPIATSARAIARCSSAWSSTARPAIAAGRCCSTHFGEERRLRALRHLRQLRAHRRRRRGCPSEGRGARGGSVASADARCAADRRPSSPARPSRSRATAPASSRARTRRA